MPIAKHFVRFRSGSGIVYLGLVDIVTVERTLVRMSYGNADIVVNDGITDFEAFLFPPPPPPPPKHRIVSFNPSFSAPSRKKAGP